MEGPQPTLTTARLTLRPQRKSDAPDLVRLAGAREIAAMTLMIPHPYEPPMAEEWIEKAAAGWLGDTMAVFAITGTDSGELVGSIGLKLDLRNNHAELGYWIGLPHWGNGYATEASRGILEFSFGQLGLHRVHAHAFGTNPASCRILEKIGMKYEGTLRQHIQKWDHWQDMVMYGVLRHEFSAGSSPTDPVRVVQ